MGPTTTALVLNYGVPVSMFLIHVIAGFFKDKQHATTVQAIASAGAAGAIQAVATGAKPADIGKAAAAAALGAAVTALPEVTVQDPTATPAKP